MENLPIIVITSFTVGGLLYTIKEKFLGEMIDKLDNTTKLYLVLGYCYRFCNWCISYWLSVGVMSFYTRPLEAFLFSFASSYIIKVTYSLLGE